MILCLMHSFASEKKNENIEQRNGFKYATMGNAIHELNLFRLNLLISVPVIKHETFISLLVQLSLASQERLNKTTAIKCHLILKL